MRVSTMQVFEAGARNMMNSAAMLHRTQNQLSTGRRILTPADDPVAASQILLDMQAKSINFQHLDNQRNAHLQLALAENRLNSVVSSIQFIQEQLVAASNSIYSDDQRQFFANALQAELDFLISIANTTNASGNYLFSGFMGDTQPFQMINGEILYHGDRGQRLFQVGPTQQIAISDSGYDIFMRNRTGNGVFETDIGSNLGTGTISSGSVLNRQAWIGHAYTIEFTSATVFVIRDNVTGAISPPQTYTSGEAITPISGISFAISGEPQAGDTFTITPSTHQSVFETVQNLVDVLSRGINSGTQTITEFQNGIRKGAENLNLILDNVAGVIASIGSRQNQLASLTDVSMDLDLNFEQKISRLRDIDLAETISLFMTQELQLQAAQNSFARIASLSLLNFI